MRILDANAILRYLLRDIPEISEEVREAVLDGASTTAEVLAEVVYVLAGVYHADRLQIADTLIAFVGEVDISHPASVHYALRLYRQTRLDFVDCVLSGYHHTEGADILTFDKKLQKALECVSKCREMQFRVDLTAFQGAFPQTYWLQVKEKQRRNAVIDAENALQAF